MILEVASYKFTGYLGSQLLKIQPFLLAFAGFSLGVHRLVPRLNDGELSSSCKRRGELGSSCKRRGAGLGPGNEARDVWKLSDVSRMREATCF